MIDLNDESFSVKKSYNEKLYNMDEAAELLGFSFGRNKLYKILKELGIINPANCPVQKYIDEGYLAVKVVFLRPNPKFLNHPITLVVGEKGLDFVKEQVLKYLDNPEEATKNVIKPGVEYEDNSSGIDFN